MRHPVLRRTSVRIIVSCFAILAISLFGSIALTVSTAGDVAAQVTDIEDDAPIDDAQLGRIVGDSAAGPDPDDAGDRGGWVQLLIGALLLGGAGLFLYKVFSAVGTPGNADNT